MQMDYVESTNIAQIHTLFWAERPFSLVGVGSFDVILTVETFRNEITNNSLVL